MNLLFFFFLAVRQEDSMGQWDDFKMGEFCTRYNQVPHLDCGRCNAPAPTLSCG